MAKEMDIMSIEEQVKQLKEEVQDLQASIVGWYRYIDEITHDYNLEVETLHSKIELAYGKIDKNVEKLQDIKNESSQQNGN